MEETKYEFEPEEFKLFTAFVYATDDKGVLKAASALPVAVSLADLKIPSKLGPVKFNWKMNMESDYRAAGPRRYRPDVEEYLRKRAQEMVDADIAVYGDSIYASPWVTVRKKSGGYREFVDMRCVNFYMELSGFPVTSTIMIIRRLSDPRWKYYSELDLKIAFWQVEISVEDRVKCAVSGPNILLLMNRLPQGGRDSSAQLERLLVESLVLPFEKFFGDRALLAIYRDNLFLATMDLETHAEALSWLADKSNELNLKCGSGTIGSRSVSVLGFELDPTNVRPARAAIEKCRVLKRPCNRKELRSVLGVFNYYRGLIPEYAAIVAPMEKLLSSKETFDWNDECEESLKTLKNRIDKASTGRYSPRRASRIYTDASGEAAGAVLVQNEEIVGVFSRKFKGAQVKYSVTRKEALALLWAVMHFDDLLVGETPVYTDQQPLVPWSRGAESNDPLLARWGLKLNEFRIIVIYLPGSENGLADFMSRHHEMRFKRLGKDEQIISEFVSESEEENSVTHNNMAQRKNPDRAARHRIGEVARAPLDPNERFDWLVEIHEALNHGSVSAMKAALQGQVDWPTKGIDLQEIVDTCDLCQRQAIVRVPVQEPIVTARSSWRINDEASADLINSLP